MALATRTTPLLLAWVTGPNKLVTAGNAEVHSVYSPILSGSTEEVIGWRARQL